MKTFHMLLAGAAGIALLLLLPKIKEFTGFNTTARRPGSLPPGTTLPPLPDRPQLPPRPDGLPWPTTRPELTPELLARLPPHVVARIQARQALY